MNVRLIKEMRELVPVFIGTLLLIVVPYLIWRDQAGVVAGFVLAGGCLVLAGSSFGNEFAHRTFSLLLSQPVPRSVLWRDKMLVMGAGTVACLAVAEMCLWEFCPNLNLVRALTLVVIALCAFCGAPFWTLVLRHGINGVACAVGAPFGLLAILALLSQWLGVREDLASVGGVLLLLLYCALTYWRGYVLFKRIEDYERPARELKLPARWENTLVRPLAGTTARFRGPFVTLLKKELRLQQICFLLAGGFFLIAVVGFCLRPLHHPLGEALLGADFGFFALVLPMIAGVIAGAEEKGWGLAEWHLTLPPSALQQWSAKMLATLGTSLGLGLLLPLALFLAGTAVLNPHSLRGSLPPASAPAAWMLGQLLLTSVAVYAASFCRNTNQAIGATFGIVAASVSLMILMGDRVSAPFGRWVLSHLQNQVDMTTPVLLIGLLLMLCLTQGFAWWNFHRPGKRACRWVAQLLVLFLAVGVVSLALTAAMAIAPVAGKH